MLLCLTANHRNASFDLLDRLSVGAPVAAETLVENGDIVAGAVVLATCNRFEAYLDVDEPVTAASAVAVEQTVQMMSEASGVDPDALRDSLTVITGDGVAEHLFAVSSGLESVIVGEDEISGQVRRALERARIAGTTSSPLERLFQHAARASRGVKNRTALGGAGRSLVRLGLELAASRIADWSTTRVLVVGTGQYAATTLVALRDRGVTDISVFSPSGRGSAFALKHSLTVATSPDLDVDLIITCTSNEQPVITPDLVLPGRRLVIDLGLPRNVDPRVTDVEGVELLDLETISIHAPLEELNATEDARALIRAAATEFATASAEDEVTPALVALRSHIFSVLDAEVARLHGPDAPRIEAALRHLTGVLLHTPSVRARELARSGDAAGFAEAVTALFGVSVEAADAAAVASDEGERLA